MFRVLGTLLRVVGVLLPALSMLMALTFGDRLDELGVGSGQWIVIFWIVGFLAGVFLRWWGAIPLVPGEMIA